MRSYWGIVVDKIISILVGKRAAGATLLDRPAPVQLSRTSTNVFCATIWLTYWDWHLVRVKQRAMAVANGAHQKPLSQNLSPESACCLEPAKCFFTRALHHLFLGCRSSRSRCIREWM